MIHAYEKFYTLNPQFYERLWLSDKSPSSFLEQDKANQKLNERDFKHKLKKAVFGRHTKLLFDEGFLENKNLKKYIHWTRESRIRPVILLSMTGFSEHKNQLENLSASFPPPEPQSQAPSQKRESPSYDFGLEFHFISEDNNFSLRELSAFKNKSRLIYVIHKYNRKSFLKEEEEAFLSELKIFFKKRHLCFPYKSHFRDRFLTPRQVYHFLNKNLRLPPYPAALYDSRIPEDMDLEPLYEPFFKSRLASGRSSAGSFAGSSVSSSLDSSKREIYFSVVIPVYNRERQLFNTLKFLAAGDFPKNKYEVIVVDDGSSRPIRQSLTSFSKQNPLMDIKGIYFPRVIEKTKNLAHFRAGLARNLGVKHSRGRYLAFLDSDILTPPDYLTKLKKEHERADLILVKRRHLKSDSFSINGGLSPEDLFPTAAKELKSPGDSKKKADNIKTYIKEESYWGDFYKKGFDKAESPWKYICTYGLSLLREDFNSIGGFGKTFLFYGFEDIDLGWRLLKKNKKALLSDIVVFHQASEEEGAPSSRLYPLFRQSQLLKTAKIFFYRHLDTEIYKALRVYMRQERPLSYFL